jgi:hypothetical protein
MDTKKYLYAAVGAPIVVTKGVMERADGLRTKLQSRSEDLGREARTRFDEWSTEGEDLIARLKDAEAIDEFTSKMDLDQVQEQVSKLRDQLEDLLDTWRSNFRPAGKVEVTVEAEAVIEEPEPAPKTEKPSTKTTATKKPAEKPAEKPAAKKPAAKKPAAKKPAAKKPAADTESAKAS